MSRLGKDVNKILQGIKDGRDEYKELLFQTRYNHLTVIARMHVHNQNDVEDVLQITYLRVFQYIQSWDSSKDGYNWLCRIVQNEAYRINTKNPDHLPLEAYAKQPDPKDFTDGVFAKSELSRYLAGYSDFDCQLIKMKFYEDYSYAEMAKKLKMKRSTLHRRVSIMVKEILAKRERELDENER